MTASVPANPGDEFVVQVKPRVVREGHGVLYDIKAFDAHNDKLLVFSNQGYENRSDAVDTVHKLFHGRPATLRVFNAAAELEHSIDLRASE